MLSTPGNIASSFRTTYSNVKALRPSATAWGTSVAPAQNSYGTPVSLGITCTKACFGIWVSFYSGFTSVAIRNMLVNINMDPTGGTTYTTVLLPDLIASCAGGIGGVTQNGISYYFPIYIPAGATLAAAASVNNATVGTVIVAATAFTDPTHPESLVYGHKCEAIGTVAASSEGTAVTCGTTNEGAWTSLGTTTRTNFYWQMGFSVNNGTITALAWTMELAADNNGTTPQVIIPDISISTTSLEVISYNAGSVHSQCFTQVASGATIYARGQCSGTLITGTTMIAYGIG